MEKIFYIQKIYNGQIYNLIRENVYLIWQRLLYNLMKLNYELFKLRRIFLTI